MKKFLCCSVVIFCLFWLSADVNADEVLDGWVETQWNPISPVQITRDPGHVIFSADGSHGAQWGGLKKYYSSAIGIFGNITLKEGSGNASSGFSKFLGITPAKTLIEAQIQIEINQQRLSVGYHVREWIQDTRGNWSRSMVGDLASGILGDRRGDYNIGDTIAIGFALIENQVWFHTTKREYVTIYQPLFDIHPVFAPFEIFSWAEKGDANKAVTQISDVVIF